MAPVKAGRVRKTQLFFEDAPRFVDMLAADIDALVRRAAKRNLIPCVRLNGTSDIPWERMRGSDGRTLMAVFPNVQFYDYTKRPNRAECWPNYHLTFSRSECNDTQCLIELNRGRNVAVVFDTRKGEELPMFWNGFCVVDGDESDLRFRDPRDGDGRAVIVGLRAKGDAKGETSGFVQIGENS
jgi:hypothetical protein